MSPTVHKQELLEFAASDRLVVANDDWTYSRAPTREHVHVYHDYPARMIPQVAARIIELYGRNARTLFDPYCGSGTSLVEAILRGIDAAGTDLNPLARLISEAKTGLPTVGDVDAAIAKAQSDLASNPKGRLIKSIDGITDLEFWFKREVVQKLDWLSNFIAAIRSKRVQRFFQVAFSETARESSNTRASEFKLYRYPDKKLAEHNPDVYGIFLAKLLRNRHGLAKFYRIATDRSHCGKAKVYDFNSVVGIPASKIPPQSIDIVVTSPPYGDSRTTVAYGQYSRLSSAWLRLEEPHNIDQRLMGGQPNRIATCFPSTSLNRTIDKITNEDEKRSREVAAFYADLLLSIQNVSGTIRTGGYACYVVGNRKVKGVLLPTSQVINDFFSASGFDHVATHSRSIPNKRMPSRNSPSNRPGVLDDTMSAEYIVVMQKR